MLTWVEINTKAIRHNLKQIKQHIGKQVLLMPVIKSNAYGHGFLTVARVCHQSVHVNRLCVASLEEALELIKNKLHKKPILILSFFDRDEKKLHIAVKNNIIFPLYSFEDARLLNRVGERNHKKIKVHVKIDTGTSRLGILPVQTLNFIKQLQKYRHLEIEGLWSHFASSESDANFTKTQNNTLRLVDEQLKKQGIHIPIKHIACSAAIFNHIFTHASAVRLGLGLYGLYPNQHKKIKLQPVLSWYTRVIQVKTVPKGTKIGYGGTYTTKRPTTIAVLPVGYFDGYDRRLSNTGKVLINGKFCKILGRICMNICMVDVTNIQVQAGDKVTLIGKDKKQSISADDMAAWCKTINYEIVSRINPLLPRIAK